MVRCQCAVACNMERVWWRSNSPKSLALGAGTSATVNGLGCVSSQRSMAGGLMAKGTPAKGYALYSASSNATSTAVVAAAIDLDSLTVMRSTPYPASTDSASIVRITNRDGMRMKFRPGSQYTWFHSANGQETNIAVAMTPSSA